MTRRIKTAIAAPLAVLAALVLLIGGGMLAGCGSGDSGGGGASGDSASAPEPARAQAAANGAAEQVMGWDAGAASKSMSGGDAVAEGDYSAAVPPASTPSSHYLLRTGDLSLLVARGDLPATVDRIKATTTTLGGYVMSSSLGAQSHVDAAEPMPLDDAAVSTDGGVSSSAATESSFVADPYASIIVRVPEQSFDTAVKRFSRLGEVQGVSTSSEDVTSQYVDLQARLRHFRAVERRLVGFLQETTTVNQMLAVQDRIDDVQLTIEELSAQFKSLRETTTYGTLSVYVSERDRTPATIQSSNTFGGTLSNSIKLLGRGIRVTGLVLTALAPFIVLFGVVAAVVWYAARRVRRSRRQAASPTQPA